MKEFIIKNIVDYRIRVVKKQCDNPKTLYTIEFAQETMKEGKVTNVSTYNLFLTETEIDLLIQGLK